MSDINTLIKHFIHSFNELKIIFEMESEALEHTDTPRFLALQEQKKHKAHAYQNDIAILLARKHELKQADNALKSTLENIQREYTALMTRNMRAIKRIQRSTERLGNTLRKAASEAVRKNRIFSYGANGTLREDNKRKISISLSETA